MYNIHVIGKPEIEERKKEAEELFEVIIVERFPKFRIDNKQ